ncbi:MAG: hypothetical protein IJK62_13195 [Bacteroidales bacterium]|nr:hypothetical protein [Bacteroidales bacterium]
MDEVKDIHIGSLIKAKVEEQGKKHSWLAKQINCSPKSRVDLAGSRVVTALGYAVQFFFIPPCIIGLIEYFG